MGIDQSGDHGDHPVQADHPDRMLDRVDSQAGSTRCCPQNGGGPTVSEP